MDVRDSKSRVPGKLPEPAYREIPRDNSFTTRRKMAFKLKNKKSLSKYLLERH